MRFSATAVERIVNGNLVAPRPLPAYLKRHGRVS
jgi:hypothetical protein